MSKDYRERVWVTFDAIWSDRPKKDAICFNNDGNALWIPRSLLHPEHENIVEKFKKNGEVDSVDVHIPIWFAEQEELI